MKRTKNFMPQKRKTKVATKTMVKVEAAPILIVAITLIPLALVMGLWTSFFSFFIAKMYTGTYGSINIPIPAISSKPIAAYTFDSSATTQKDASLNNNDAICSGAFCAVYNSQGYFTFDGINDFFKIADSNSFTGLRQWTVTGWFNKDIGGSMVSSGAGGVNGYPLFTKGRGIAENADLDVSFFVGITPDNRLTADFEDTPTSLSHPIIGNTIINNGEWRQFAVIFTGTKFQLYIDGKLDKENDTNFVPTPNSILPVGIGTSLDQNGSPLGFFKGSLDNIEMHNTALSSADIQEKYNSYYLAAYLNFDSSALQQDDPAVYKNHGYCKDTECPAWTPDGKISGAFAFDGMNDYFTIEDRPQFHSTNLTVAFWFLAKDSASKTQSLVAKGEDWARDNAEWVVELNDSTSPKKIQFWFEEPNDTDHYFPSKSDIAPNTWYHFAATRNSAGNIKIYLNGALEKEYNDPATPAIVSTPVLIGARTNSPNAYQDFFNGTIDEVRIYNKTLTPEEISYLKNMTKSFYQCQDGIDNDSDQLIDMNDPGCKLATDDNESIATTQCQDGIDNDSDQLIDMNDPGCKLPTDNNEKLSTSQCQDEMDNDQDGLIDMNDPGCKLATDNYEAAATTQCQDKIDNDADGLVDMNDPGCDSSMDNSEANAITQDLIIVGDSWKYMKGTVNPPSTWNQASFDDTSWLSGKTGIGYGDNDDATVLSDMQNGYLTIYARKQFSINTPDKYNVELTINYDDGFISYINGQEIARRGMGAVGSAVTKDTASADHEAGVPEKIIVPNNVFVSGSNIMAFEVHNATLGSSDLSFIPKLTANLAGPCVNTDFDADGYQVSGGSSCPAIAQIDCNDANKNIYPSNANSYCDCNATDGFGQGRSEICGNATDENCDSSAPVCSSNAPPMIGNLEFYNFGYNRESSGIAASYQYLGVYWVHNDSGDANRIYPIFNDGKSVRGSDGNIRVVTITGAGASDWEDIAVDSVTNEVWIADFGNNCTCRTDLKLYKIFEPNPFGIGASAQVTTYPLKYPDGNFNAEALFIWKNQPYIIAKVLGQNAGVYTFPALTPGVSQTLTRIATFVSGGREVTGADISFDGKRIAITGYGWTKFIEKATINPDVIADFFGAGAKSWEKGGTSGTSEEVTFVKNSYSAIAGNEEGNLWMFEPWYYEH